MENNTGRCSIVMNGEKVDLIFGMPACERYYLDIAEGRIIVDDEGNIKSSTGIACLLYAGYWNNCVYNSLQIKHSVGTFLEFIEANVDSNEVAEQLLLIGTCFKNSTSVIKYLERKQNEITEQKKTIAQVLNEWGKSGETGNS